MVHVRHVVLRRTTARCRSCKTDRRHGRGVDDPLASGRPRRSHHRAAALDVHLVEHGIVERPEAVERGDVEALTSTLHRRPDPELIADVDGDDLDVEAGPIGGRATRLDEAPDLTASIKQCSHDS